MDVIIIGAGASGLMCAIEAGKRHRRVLVMDHAKAPGQKILLTGGGRCNFTNRSVAADHYVSHNPHFCKSALSRYTQWDFLSLVQKHHIAFCERAHGQLFCEGSSRDILNMLLAECEQAGVSFQLDAKIENIEQAGEHLFLVRSSRASHACESLVVATGGLSIPSKGASPLGHEIAGQFHIKVWPPRAGLVPLTLQPGDKEKFSVLSGIAVEAVVSTRRESFCENLLFTHRGLSGPVILQMSLYWQPGEELTIDLLPGIDLAEALKEHKWQHPQRTVKSVLAEYLPKRLVVVMVRGDLAESPLKSLPDRALREISAQLRQWTIKPNNTEGYRTAEVTVGGVDCNAISSKTMEARDVAGLFFVGEVLDVSGSLGGYNLQWAWSSGWCAGQYV
ncbi:MAG: NAD(P)/FAD-dependent oxidoreductase [Deltaproteobacteria bacterium]|nr:NAD(P)/FAD-dependent oxidoreductase [Deltaproteobacteria bacterium]